MVYKYFSVIIGEFVWIIGELENKKEKNKEF
jgi:hypothetical protein